MSAVTYLKSAASAALVACTLAVFAAPVQAESQRDFGRPLGVAVNSAAGKGEMRFDWLQSKPKADSEAVTLAAMTVSPGSGQWVCSPAGFGSKSQCRKR